MRKCGGMWGGLTVFSARANSSSIVNVTLQVIIVERQMELADCWYCYLWPSLCRLSLPYTQQNVTYLGKQLGATSQVAFSQNLT